MTLVFALPAYEPMLEHLLQAGADALERGTCSFERFAGGELHVHLGDRVDGRRCALLASLAPPDEQLLETLLAADTLRDEGADGLVAVLPYMGYARQDRAERGHSAGARWCGRLLRAAGVERLVTLDVHSERAAAAFAMPLQSLSPAPLFAAALADEGPPAGLTLVAPDDGALERCESVRRAAGVTAPVALLHKRRDERGVRHGEIEGELTERVAVVDDILDTGGTLVSACTALRRAGVRSITVCVTHALFVGEAWRALPELGVRRIYATDSSPATLGRAGPLVEVLAAGALLGTALSAERQPPVAPAS